MSRFWAMLGAFLLVCPAVHAGPRHAAPRHRHWVEASHRPLSPAPDAPIGVWPIARAKAPPVGLVRGVEIVPSAYRTELDGDAPSPAVWWVSQIAARRGERQFLVVDKVRGRLILFRDGVPVFSSPALTGLSRADFLPADALGKSYAQQVGEKYRVTPAGRFTVSQTWDRSYGEVLDINEIHGRDWGIAIHAVPLASAGYREALLRSPLDQARHITEGCVNLDPGAMRQLSRILPRRGGTPTYILPNDESLIARLFQG